MRDVRKRGKEWWKREGGKEGWMREVRKRKGKVEEGEGMVENRGKEGWRRKKRNENLTAHQRIF